MRRRKQPADGDLLGGTLDMLVLRTLTTGPAHGFRIARSIQQESGDELLVEEGSLYPALYRLEDRGWISSHWGTSENNRKARFYKLTARGRKHLHAETDRWESLVRAVARVMRPSER